MDNERIVCEWFLQRLSTISQIEHLPHSKYLPFALSDVAMDFISRLFIKVGRTCRQLIRGYLAGEKPEAAPWKAWNNMIQTVVALRGNDTFVPLFIQPTGKEDLSTMGGFFAFVEALDVLILVPADMPLEKATKLTDVVTTFHENTEWMAKWFPDLKEGLLEFQSKNDWLKPAFVATHISAVLSNEVKAFESKVAMLTPELTGDVF
eukprot:6720464-Pyramimonas_sp.AAC.1